MISRYRRAVSNLAHKQHHGGFSKEAELTKAAEKNGGTFTGLGPNHRNYVNTNNNERVQIRSNIDSTIQAVRQRLWIFDKI